MLRDSRGLMWFGSTDGLHCFDGWQWRSYRPDGQAGSLTGSNIYSRIYEDGQEDLWFSTNEAVQGYRRKSGKFETISSLPSDVQLISFEAPDFLWIKTGKQQLLQYNIAQKKLETKGKLAPGSVHVPCRDSQGRINGFLSYHYSTQGPLSYQAQGSSTVFVIDSTLSIHDLQLVSETTAWVAAEEGLFQLSLSGRPKLTRIPTPVKQWRGIARQSDGTWWFLSATAGLYCHRNGQFNAVRIRLAPHTLAFAAHPFRLYIDPEDYLWLSYDGEGIAWADLKKSGITVLELSPFIQSPAAHLEPLAFWDKQVLIGTEKEGLLCWSPDQPPGRVSPAAPVVFHTLPLSPHEGALVSMPGQVSLLTSGKHLKPLRLCTPDGRQLHTPLFYFFKHPAGKAAYATSKQFVYKIFLSGDSLLVCEPVWKSEYPSDKLYVGACDKYSNIYLNINDLEIAILPGGAPQNSIRFPLSRITGFAVDGEQVWIASSAQGLFRLDTRNLQLPPVWHLSEANGLPDQALKSILRDHQGRLWLGSGRGVVCYNPSDQSMIHLDQTDGLWENALEWKAAAMDSNNCLVFGNKKALNFIDPKRISNRSTGAVVHLTGIKVLDNDWHTTGNVAEIRALRFPYDSNTLSFHFNGIDFSDPARVRLQYRLDGLDAPGKWVETPAGTLGFARYAHLSPGDYTLQIKAVSAKGLPGALPCQIAILITPPFYETTWFRLLALLLSGATIYTIYRYRLNAVRRKEAAKRKMIELELNALRTQLNPHFVSNNLISINRFIRNNGVEKVREYVATFARLMRNVLEGARKPMVTLGEEIELLQNYVAVESGRFPQPVKFEVDLAPDIGPDLVQLPGMLLQPFVENALVHGLTPLNGEGKIRLEVRRNADHLLFEICDNGVGRQPKTDTAIETGKKSHGIDITRERLQLYDMQHQTRSSFDIRDLHHADGSGAGTCVTLKLGLPQK